MKKLLFILLTCFGLTALADINLGVTEKVKTVTTSYNALVSDDNIMVDAGGGNVTVGLPSASLKRGKVIKVFKTDSGYNAVIVNGVSMTFQNEYVKFISSGTAWLKEKPPFFKYLGNQVTTGTWTTNTTYLFNYWRDGAYLVADGGVKLSGAPNAANLAINLPLGLSVATGFSIDSGNYFRSGSGTVYDFGVNAYPASIRGNDSSSTLRVVYLVAATATYASVSATAPVQLGDNDTITISYRVPIQGWE